jgi:hypothetical protein
MLSIFKTKSLNFVIYDEKYKKATPILVLPLKGGKVGVGGTGHHVIDEREVLVYVLCGPRGVVVVQQAL